MVFGSQSNSDKADYSTCNRTRWHCIIHMYNVLYNYVEGMFYIIVGVRKECPE